MTACSRAATEYQDRTRRWRVENTVHDEYLEFRSSTSAWRQHLVVWIPDIGAIGPALVISPGTPLRSRRELGQGNDLASADIDPAAVGGEIRARLAGSPPSTPCCFERQATALCESGDYTQLVRLHAADDAIATTLPDLSATYPAAAAENGAPLVFAGQPMFDPLHARGALVDRSGIFVLWADADERLRGWEKVASLTEAVAQPRFALRGQCLLAISATPTYFPGFATVPAAEELARRAAPAVMSSSFGFDL